MMGLLKKMLNNISQKVKDCFLSGDYDEVIKLMPLGEELNYSILEKRVLACAYYRARTTASYKTGATKLLLECAELDSRYFLDVALVYLNDGDVERSIQYLKMVKGLEQGLARFYLSFLTIHKKYGIRDSKHSLSLLEEEGESHLCSMYLKDKILIGQGISKYKLILLNLRKLCFSLKMLFVAYQDPLDSRLSSQGAFEIFGIKLQPLLEALCDNSQLIEVKARIYFESR